MIALLMTIPIIFFNLFVTPLNFFNYEVLKKPEKIDVKGIYLTAYTVGWKERMQELTDFVENTELNSMVIDIKDSTGRIFFDTNVDLVNEIGAEDLRIPDIDELMKDLKERGIYTIARVAIFQDPWLAENRPDLALKREGGGLWRDYKGLAWVDTTSREVWKYNLDIIKEIITLGFDEINFDYIRFPSDGNLKAIVYPFYDENIAKTDALAEFFVYVDRELAFSNAFTSVDLFGMVLIRDDGLGIGQRFQDAVSHFDYIAPMVYPSHYPDGFEGFANPADHPYEIIKYSLNKAKEDIVGKRAEFRPWLQDFDLGAIYTADMIRKQIQATYDTGWKSWVLWNASNRYTQDALLKSENTEIFGSESEE